MLPYWRISSTVPEIIHFASDENECSSIKLDCREEWTEIKCFFFFISSRSSSIATPSTRPHKQRHKHACFHIVEWKNFFLYFSLFHSSVVYNAIISNLTENLLQIWLFPCERWELDKNENLKAFCLIGRKILFSKRSVRTFNGETFLGKAENFCRKKVENFNGNIWLIKFMFFESFKVFFDEIWWEKAGKSKSVKIKVSICK